MPLIRRNAGLGQLAAREGTVTWVPPEVRVGSHGTLTPLGTRESVHTPPRPEPIRNGLAFKAYDETAAGRAERATSPRYAHARLALARAAARYGPPPQTIRGLPGAEAVRKRRRKTVTV